MHRIRPGELRQARIFTTPPAPLATLSPLEIAVLDEIGSPRTTAELIDIHGEHARSAVAYLRRRGFIEPLSVYGGTPRRHILYVRSAAGGTALRAQLEHA